MRVRVAVAAGLVWSLAAPAASAEVRIGPERVVVTAREGSSAVIERQLLLELGTLAD